MRQVTQRLTGANPELSAAFEEHGNAINALLRRNRLGSSIVLSANQTDFVPPDQDFIPIVGNSFVIRGIDSYEDRLLTFINIGPTNVVFGHQDVLATGVKRIITSTGLDRTIAPGQTFSVIRDNSVQRWREVA